MNARILQSDCSTEHVGQSLGHNLAIAMSMKELHLKYLFVLEELENDRHCHRELESFQNGLEFDRFLMMLVLFNGLLEFITTLFVFLQQLFPLLLIGVCERLMVKNLMLTALRI